MTRSPCGVTLELHHWAPAHTSGDLVVYLPDQKILFAGDIIVAQLADPLIHLEKQGSSEGWITTVKGMLGTRADHFVPGHGDLQTRAEIQARLSAAMDKRDKIAALARDGKSLDEIRVAVGDPRRRRAPRRRRPARVRTRPGAAGSAASSAAPAPTAAAPAPSPPMFPSFTKSFTRKRRVAHRASETDHFFSGNSSTVT